MKTKRINYHMKDLDLLSEDEVRLKTLLEGVENTTLLGMVICLGLKDNTAEGFRRLAATLRSQGVDGPRIMEDAIGEEAMTLLMGNRQRNDYGRMSGQFS